MYIRDPVGELGLLIIQENTAVFDGRRTLDLQSRDNINIAVFLDRYVGPKIPGADTDLLANIVNAVDGASGIAACNHQSAGATWDGFPDHLADERLPLALDLGHIDPAGVDEIIDDL